MRPKKLYQWAAVKIPTVSFNNSVGNHSKETMMPEESFRKG
jgi:hypothetical protein